jgi:hypothetical protein
MKRNDFPLPEVLPNPQQGCSPDTYRQRWILKILAVVVLLGALVFLAGIAFQPYVHRGGF